MYKALEVTQVGLGPTSPSRPLSGTVHARLVVSREFWTAPVHCKGVDTISTCISRMSTLLSLRASHTMWTPLVAPARACVSQLRPHATAVALTLPTHARPAFERSMSHSRQCPCLRSHALVPRAIPHPCVPVPRPSLPVRVPMSRAKTLSRAHACRPDCSCTLLCVLSATLRHGLGIDASIGKTRCVSSDPLCACTLVCVCVVIATPCRDTDTLVQDARVHASTCTCAHARANPHVRTHTLQCCMACLLDAAHTVCVPVAAAPYHDVLDSGPQTRVL
ncbi:hypothetical protein SLEP1_g48366 [Rubroshorea leprosula]|uniref:Uncharacterized protein n=1 Tax=Rubroshorea leprosula TaxID=152421 RepID=A0AAV5LTE4_9ROSI|nr:hypothetical protein SLEP1_g48366 [Rubroshorea leprosula]